jgi:hypothetical protein
MDRRRFAAHDPVMAIPTSLDNNSTENESHVTTRTREIHLAARPHGLPKSTDFRLVETELPDPARGQVLVRNLVMSVDPYMRGRMKMRLRTLLRGALIPLRKAVRSGK